MLLDYLWNNHPKIKRNVEISTDIEKITGQKV